MTGWQDGVDFAFKPTREKSRTAWTQVGADDAWLVMDRDGDGSIDDGTELFGNFTAQPPPVKAGKRNGFAALALLDETRDGRVDGGDPEFAKLRLWQDRDHDGLSQPSELSSLMAHGIEGLSVVYREAADEDGHGNRYLYSARVYAAPGSRVGMTAWDVILIATIPDPKTQMAGFGGVALTRPQAEDEPCGGGNNAPTCTKSDVLAPNTPNSCQGGYVS